MTVKKKKGETNNVISRCQHYFSEKQTLSPKKTDKIYTFPGSVYEDPGEYYEITVQG